MFEMRTTAPNILSEYDSSPAGLALTLADRLKWTTDVPVSRFAFWFPDPAATVDPSNVLFCEASNVEATAGAHTARYATSKNTTFSCQAKKHKMNATMVPISMLETDAAMRPLTFEVGVYPASGLDGDTKPAIQVAEDIAGFSSSGDEPERTLLKTGLWTYKAGPGVKFHGLFPATSAAMPGTRFADPRETSLPLGPNPGGHGAMPPVKAPPGMGKDFEMQKEDLNNVDSIVHEANKINGQVSRSLQELKDSLARASAVHSAWMNTNVYELPDLVR